MKHASYSDNISPDSKFTFIFFYSHHSVCIKWTLSRTMSLRINNQSCKDILLTLDTNLRPRKRHRSTHQIRNHFPANNAHSSGESIKLNIILKSHPSSGVLFPVCRHSMLTVFCPDAYNSRSIHIRWENTMPSSIQLALSVSLPRTTFTKKPQTCVGRRAIVLSVWFPAATGWPVFGLAWKP